jgi:hypothetical protein
MAWYHPHSSITAVLGFTLAGVAAELIPGWHAWARLCRCRAAVHLFAGRLLQRRGRQPPRTGRPDRLARLGELDRRLQHHPAAHLATRYPGRRAGTPPPGPPRPARSRLGRAGRRPTTQGAVELLTEARRGRCDFARREVTSQGVRAVRGVWAACDVPWPDQAGPSRRRPERVAADEPEQPGLGIGVIGGGHSRTVLAR